MRLDPFPIRCRNCGERLVSRVEWLLNRAGSILLALPLSLGSAALGMGGSVDDPSPFRVCCAKCGTWQVL